MNKEQLARYAELKKSIKEMEQEVELLKESITPDLVALGGQQDTEYGIFRLQKNTRYQYPNEVKEEITQCQLKSQLDGTAKVVETIALYFNPIKE